MKTHLYGCIHDLKLHREKRARERTPSGSHVIVHAHANHAILQNETLKTNTLMNPSGAIFISRHFKSPDGRNRYTHTPR